MVGGSSPPVGDSFFSFRFFGLFSFDLDCVSIDVEQTIESVVSCRQQQVQGIVDERLGCAKEDIFRVISFLKTIVDGIDYFQSTMAHHIDVSHILNSLLLFYQ